jgi:hypothetical protein
MVAQQREFISLWLKARSQSHIIYDGLDRFAKGEKIDSLLDIPGIAVGIFKSSYFETNLCDFLTNRYFQLFLQSCYISGME